jgi:hypothetical protein
MKSGASQFLGPSAVIDLAVVRTERRAPARLGAAGRYPAKAELELGVPAKASLAPLLKYLDA